VIGAYRPGSSWLHRAGAASKLAGLAALALGLVALRSPEAVLGGALVVVLVGATSGVGPGAAVAVVWPLRWVVALLVPFQWWAGGWRAAVVVVGAMLVTVAAAGLVTLTTRVTDMLAVLAAALRPLRRLGVDPERVALVLALAIRTVPVLAGIAGEVRDARRARGLERSPRALLVPLAVRTVRHADRTGEALAARGLDD
jgi:biotin transport system permease protein